jgi:LysR family hydrogen peroxide-inducible transcriptional activator
MHAFLQRLAEVFRQLPADLLDAHSAASPAPTEPASASRRGRRTATVAHAPDAG